MSISIDTYGFRKIAISRELQDRLTSGACVACAGEVGDNFSRVCRDCMIQLAENGEEILSPEVASYLYKEFNPASNLNMNLQGWAEESLKNQENEGEVPLASREVLTNPSKIEDTYRQVGEDEWKWEREGPVGTRTMEKLYPGSMPGNTKDLGRQYVPKPTPEYSDWLEMKEPGGKKKPQDEETYLTPIEPVESQKHELGKITKNKTGGTMLVELYKLAYDLDRKGLHSEAEEIEEVMKLMAQRVGLKVEDMVSLANHFDDLGDIALADRFDTMAKEAAGKDKEKMLKLKEKLKKAKEKEKAEKEKLKAKKLKEKERADKEKEKAKAKKEKADK